MGDQEGKKPIKQPGSSGKRGNSRSNNMNESQNDDQEAESLDEQLQSLKELFEQEGQETSGPLEYKVSLMRRKKSDAFSAEECLFRISFEEKSDQSKNITLMSCLLSIHAAMRNLMKQIKDFYKDILDGHDFAERLIYFSIWGDYLTSPIFLGKKRFLDVWLEY